jgi:hypothetical protein
VSFLGRDVSSPGFRTGSITHLTAMNNMSTRRLSPFACWSKRLVRPSAVLRAGEVNGRWPDPSSTILTPSYRFISPLNLKPFGVGAVLK